VEVPLSAPPTVIVPASQEPGRRGRRRRRPVLRIALFGIATVLAAFVAITIAETLWSWHLDVLRDRATATTDGLITQDNIGPDADIQVRWTDNAGRSHTQIFYAYDTDKYTRGRKFPIAYDPKSSHPRGYSQDRDETLVDDATDDDLIGTLDYTEPVVFLVLLGWSARGRRYLRNVGGPRPEGRLPATALAGRRRRVGFLSRGTSAWIALSTGSEPGWPADRLQRVMWHPSLERLPAEFPVVVHGNPVRCRRVVIELADGVRLVPIGRLRRRTPRLTTLHRLAATPEPADVPSDPTPAAASTDAIALTRSRWWRVAPSAVIGAALGAGVGYYLTSDIAGALSYSTCVAALMVNRWALAGTGPDHRDRRFETPDGFRVGQPIPSAAT